MGANTAHAIEMQFASGFTLGNIGVLTQGVASLDFTLAGLQPAGACTLGTAYNGWRHVLRRHSISAWRTGIALGRDPVFR